MLFMKKCYLFFLIIGCSYFNLIISSDPSSSFTELEENEMRDFFEGIYNGTIDAESLEDYWVAINYVISNHHKLTRPLAEVDKIRLKQLINIVDNKDLSNAEKFFDITYIINLHPKPSHHTAKIFKRFANNYYNLNEQSMPLLELNRSWLLK